MIGLRASRAALALTMAGLIVLSSTSPAFAYLKFGIRVGERTVDIRWTQMPIRYFVNEQSVPTVSGTQFREAVQRAFATWQAIPTATIRAEFAGDTIALPNAVDGRTTLGFVDRPDLDRVLAATSFIIDTTTGQIVESDIFFNSRFVWSAAAAGENGKVDVESIAVHEIGHLLGFGHSALGETELVPSGRRVIAAGAVMFPIAYTAGNITARTLTADDIAAAVDVYGTTTVEGELGSLAGRVTKNGRGLFGAHVVAFNPETGALVSGFSLNEAGDFVIAGLTPGPYILRIEPIDDAATDSFFAGTIDVDFRVMFAPRLVVVPRGGGSERIEIAVGPK